MFFMPDPKPLLLVDNHKTQILETNIRGKKAMRANHNITAAFVDLRDNLLLLGLGLKS